MSEDGGASAKNNRATAVQGRAEAAKRQRKLLLQAQRPRPEMSMGVLSSFEYFDVIVNARAPGPLPERQTPAMWTTTVAAAVFVSAAYPPDLDSGSDYRLFRLLIHSLFLTDGRFILPLESSPSAVSCYWGVLAGQYIRGSLGRCGRCAAPL